MVGADLDNYDDGIRNGSAGVKFVQSHDDVTPYLANVAHAYVLMLPGNAVVYFNVKEFGDNREFPKDGRGDALGGVYGDAITTLNRIRNSHGRGDYRQRYLSKELFAYERSGSSVVGLSNRLDEDYDEITVDVDLPYGTYLVELTGNASDATVDPNDDIPEVIQVYSVCIPRSIRLATNRCYGHRNERAKTFSTAESMLPSTRCPRKTTARTVGTRHHSKRSI